MNVNSKDQNNKQKVPYVKPNEFSGVYFSTFIKIYDPNTKQILVQKRGDS